MADLSIREIRGQMGLSLIKIVGALCVALCAAVFLGSCTPASKQFNSELWKSGDINVRGTMVQDLLDRRVLLGKSPADVQQLLGKPDYIEDNWYAYKVATLKRCRDKWECRLEIAIDKLSQRVTEAGVSD